jgi:3',5'-cyclic AMP phosphodiesterase CpdA
MTGTRHARPIAIILLAVLAALPAAAEDFWFAAVADTHMRNEAACEIVRDAVQMINADERIEMSLWLGDITDRSTEREFVLSKQVLGGLDRPWHPVRGNHDDEGGFFESYFGPANRRVEHEGWVFLLFDSNGPKGKIVTDETMAWLREQAATIDPRTPVVLAAHHPIVLGGMVPLAGAPEILALFEGHNLQAVLAGHLHANMVNEYQGAMFTVNNCCATTRGNVTEDPRRGYRLFHAKDGTLTTEFVTVREIPEG